MHESFLARMLHVQGIHHEKDSIMTRTGKSLIAFVAAALLPFGAAIAADGLKPLSGINHVQAQEAAEEAAKRAKKLAKKLKPGRLPTGGIVTGGGVMELSAQDCKNVGGKVITVTDNRCGASGKYCRMPDTNAVCIDILN
jgi:hypothetical protein